MFDSTRLRNRSRTAATFRLFAGNDQLIVGKLFRICRLQRIAARMNRQEMGSVRIPEWRAFRPW